MAQAHLRGLEREDDYSVGNPEKAGPDRPSILSWLWVSRRCRTEARPDTWPPEAHRVTGRQTCGHVIPSEEEQWPFTSAHHAGLALSNSTWFNSSRHQDPWEDGQTIIPMTQEEAEPRQRIWLAQGRTTATFCYLAATAGSPIWYSGLLGRATSSW